MFRVDIPALAEKIKGILPRGKHRDEASLSLQVPTHTAEKISVAPKKNAVKPQQVIVLVGMLALAAGGGYFMVAHQPKAPAPQQTTSKDEKEDDTSLSAIDVQALAVNPFVEVASGNVVPAGNTNQVKPAGNMNLPAIGANPRPSVPSSAPSSYTPSSLPAIPSVNPRPSGMPAPGELNVKVPPNDGSQSSGGGSNVTVQGVMTGDDGNNMAILSDGTIVGEGETYKDGRVAYIGGDGIQFDNGEKLEYK